MSADATTSGNSDADHRARRLRGPDMTFDSKAIGMVILSGVKQVLEKMELKLEPLIIAAPFGNYVQPPGAVTATLGTFTAAARSGRVWRIIKTVRYYRRLGAWVNKIGLRNPGIDWLVQRVQSGRVDVSNKIVSIHGFEPADWTLLLERIESIKPAAVELNMSCPNVGEIHVPTDLFQQAVAGATPVIVKLPPVRYEAMVEGAIGAGIRAFHCCNTLPVPAGGLSGKPLKPLSLRCLRDMRSRWPEPKLTLVGGGGVTSVADVDEYIEAGADHVSVGTMTMHPRYLWTTKPLDPLILRAKSQLRG